METTLFRELPEMPFPGEKAPKNASEGAPGEPVAPLPLRPRPIAVAHVALSPFVPAAFFFSLNIFISSVVTVEQQHAEGGSGEKTKERVLWFRCNYIHVCLYDADFIIKYYRRPPI